MRGLERCCELLVASTLLIGAASCGRPPDFSKARASAPVILISIDTLRADHLPAYGYDRVRTPAIDQLAKESTLFEHCYSHCPQTLPSHVTILTGMLPFETGVRDNVGFFVRENQETLADVLKREGFQTGGFVSSYVLRGQTRIGLGFEHYDSEMTREKAEVSMGELQRHGKDTLAAAETWLDQVRSDQPAKRFFMLLHFYEPHSPYTPPEPYRTEYAGRPYDGEVAYVDELVGDFVQYLRDTDLYDQALIILTSDHGEGLGDHGEGEHGVFIYNAMIHVPLLVKYPGGALAGERVETPVQLIDIVPTILDFYALKSPLALEGSSLIGIGASRPRRVIYSESLYPMYHFGWSELYSLTDAQYKFIKSPREELYDLTKDPGEKENLAAKLATTAGQYRYEIDQTLASRSVEAPAEISEEELEKLQALGYIGVVSTQLPENAQKPDPKDKIHLIEKFRLGLQLHRKGDEAGAASAFESILAENPNMVDVMEQLGRSLSALGRTEDAANVLRRTAELDSGNPYALVRVARLLWKLNKPDEALHYIETALEKDPTLAKGWELQGQVQFSKGNAAQAALAMDRAIALDPALPMPHYVKGIVAYQKGRLDDALVCFRRAERQMAKGDPRVFLPSLHYHIGRVLEQKGQKSEAMEEYRRELAALPSNVGARITLAMLLLDAGRRQEAVALFDDHRAKTPEAFTAVIRFLRSIGETERAARVASEAAQALGGRRGQP
ncbi:MAG: sulfatase-like hydrolase/transferase [Acidobacteriota bacterium]